MTKIKSLVATTLLAATTVTPVLAEQVSYGGASVAFLNFSDDGFGESFSLIALNGRLGTYFNDNFSGELRAGVGVSDDSASISGTDVTVELDTFFGGYLRGHINTNSSLKPYGLIGYTRGELTASASGLGSQSASESDVSFGIGVDMELSGGGLLNFEYTNFLDKDGGEIDGFSVGYVARFK